MIRFTFFYTVVFIGIMGLISCEKAHENENFVVGNLENTKSVIDPSYSLNPHDTIGYLHNEILKNFLDSNMLKGLIRSASDFESYFSQVSVTDIAFIQ